MDVADFFGSVTEIQAYRVFLRLGYGALVSFEMARLCTYKPERSPKYKWPNWKVWPREWAIEAYSQDFLGRLPQGAPTSPMLSNLAVSDLDCVLSELALKAGLTYTRYSDDLTFSTRGEFSRARAAALIGQVSLALRKVGMIANRKKTVVVPPGARKVVLGLLVDGDTPRLSRDVKDCLRQHLYYLEKVGPRLHAEARNFDSIGGMYRHLRGLIDYAKMVEVDYATAMLQRFDRVGWPTL